MGEDEAGTARAVSEHRERHVRYSTVCYPPIPVVQIEYDRAQQKAH